MISAPRLRDLSHPSGIGTSRRNRMTRRTSMEADDYDPAAPARSATPSVVAQGAQILPLFSRREIPTFNLI
eukprot:2531690-Heterocapsa_arctica.AAC.1